MRLAGSAAEATGVSASLMVGGVRTAPVRVPYKHCGGTAASPALPGALGRCGVMMMLPLGCLRSDGAGELGRMRRG